MHTLTTRMKKGGEKMEVVTEKQPLNNMDKSRGVSIKIICGFGC